MTSFDYDKAAIRMNGQAEILRACADALVLDLSPAPVILATDDPYMDIANIHKLSGFLGLDAIEIGLGETSFENLQYLVNSEIGFYVIRGYDDDSRAELGSVLELINTRVFTPAVVLIVAGLRHEESVLDAIYDVLGVHPAHIPVARVSLGRKLKQPVRLMGSLHIEGSKCGQRTMSIETGSPYLQSVFFTLHAKDDQDDDFLNQAIADLGTTVAVRLKEVDGYLECTLDDIESCD